MYTVTEKDLKGALEGFPIEVVQLMIKRQLEYSHIEDISIFQKDPARKLSGFDWDKTEEEYGFWHDVIANKNFDVFFKRYPKKGKELIEITLHKKPSLKLNFNL